MPSLAPPPHSTFDLAASARGEMVREGFHLGEPDGSATQLAGIQANFPATLTTPNSARRDLTSLLWSSIDNDTSRDLDQAEYAEETPAGTRTLVAIADVAAAVAKDTPLDQFAAAQTQTVYTAVQNFPMLPTELSTNLTSLNAGQPRAAIVCEYTVSSTGSITAPAIYAALIRNQASSPTPLPAPFLKISLAPTVATSPSSPLPPHSPLNSACRMLLPNASNPPALPPALSTSIASRPTPSSSTAKFRPCMLSATRRTDHAGTLWRR